jgi:hypothetical protein
LKDSIKMVLGELDCKDIIEIEWLRVRPSGRLLWQQWWTLISIIGNFLISRMAYHLKEDSVSYHGIRQSCEFPWLPCRPKSFHLVTI